jgi:hypothetical protein
METGKEQANVLTDEEIEEMIARGELPTAAEFMQSVLADIGRLEVEEKDS